ILVYENEKKIQAYIKYRTSGSTIIVDECCYDQSQTELISTLMIAIFKNNPSMIDVRMQLSKEHQLLDIFAHIHKEESNMTMVKIIDLKQLFLQLQDEWERLIVE